MTPERRKEIQALMHRAGFLSHQYQGQYNIERCDRLAAIVKAEADSAHRATSAALEADCRDWKTYATEGGKVLAEVRRDRDEMMATLLAISELKPGDTSALSQAIVAAQAAVVRSKSKLVR